MQVVIESEIAPHDPQLYHSDRLAEKVPGFDALDEQALRRYDEHGYLIVAGGLTAGEVTSARDELIRMTSADDPDCDSIYYEGAIRRHLPLLAASGAATSGGKENARFEDLALGDTGQHLPSVPADVRSRYVRKFMGFSERHEPLRAVAYKKQLFDAVTRLARHKVRLFQDMAMIKPPRGREKPWHQDHAYFNLPLDTRIVGVWIALDRVGPENGCMFLLAGGHKSGPRTHFMRRDWQLCDTDILGTPSVCAAMDAGDILLFDAKLPHGTPTNHTDAWRWAIQLHYVPAEVSQVDEQVRLDAFGNEGKNVSC
ncbi:MAG: phytanoyl-CoA dioxygenase family protein [Phycisphaeraceae bacterium]|nr:phytanoyl-CoA dioxygenase family protein [Phycisphaeraceae bacterium]